MINKKLTLKDLRRAKKLAQPKPVIISMNNRDFKNFKEK